MTASTRQESSRHAVRGPFMSVAIDESREAVARRAVATIVVSLLLIVLAWAGTWWLFSAVFKTLIHPQWHWLWWLCAKLVVWILPLWVWFGRTQSGATAVELSGLLVAPPSRRLLIGVALWLGLSFAVAVAMGQVPVPGVTNWLVLRTALVSPLLEELLFRGLMMSFLLRRGVRLGIAVAITSVGFLLLHTPGWAFTTGLEGSLDLAARIVVLGAFLGVVTGRSGSIWPAYAVHAANNSFSTGLLIALFKAT